MSSGLDDSLARGGHVREELPAYIDGSLSVEERGRVRLHLEGCKECQAEYIELRGVQMLLRSVPVVAPPRAFTLTKEMVGERERGGFWQRILAPRNAPRFATGSVLAFALLVLIVVGDFAGGSEMLATAPFASEAEVPSMSSKAAPPAIDNAQGAESGIGATGAGAADATTGQAATSPNSSPQPQATPEMAEAGLPAEPSGNTSALAEVTATTGATALEAAPSTEQPYGIAPSTAASTPTPNPAQVTSGERQTTTEAVTASGVSSPSTLAMEENSDSPQGNAINRTVLPVAEPQSGSTGLLLGLEVALAALAVLLGVSAVVASRKT